MIRLVTKDTVEEDIHALGQTKLALDDRVAGISEGADVTKAENQGKEIVKAMIMSKLEKEMKSKD